MDLDTAAFVFYGAILLLSLGEDGRSAALNEFLHQQFLSQPKNPRERTDEQEGLDFWRKTLWALAWYLGAMIPLFLFEREASIEEAQNQENDIVKQEERGKEPCQASGSLSLRLDKILAGGGAWYQSGDLGIADSSFKPPPPLWGRVECPNGSAHTDADFGPEFDPESGSYFEDPEPDPELGSYFDDLDPDLDYDEDDPDPDSEDDPDSDDDHDPEFVYDSDLDPDFDSDSSPDSGSDPDPNSYSTCILCIFRCTDYDFLTNDPDTWTRLRILW
ncbi:unnamed protein product [Prunus armeniaca]